MRRLLVDTHVPLWYLGADRRLGRRARGLIEDPEAEVHLSAASIWEIAIKSAIGKLKAPDDLPERLVDLGFRPLPVSETHAWLVRSLPRHHTDPFDRLIVAQAMHEQMDLLTFDEAFAAYGLSLA